MQPVEAVRLTENEVAALEWAHTVLVTRREIDWEFAQKIGDLDVRAREGARECVRKTGDSIRLVEKILKLAR